MKKTSIYKENKIIDGDYKLLKEWFTLKKKKSKSYSSKEK